MIELQIEEDNKRKKFFKVKFGKDHLGKKGYLTEIFQVFIPLDRSEDFPLCWTQHYQSLLNSGDMACIGILAPAKLVSQSSVANVQETFFSNQSGASLEKQSLGALSR